MISAATLVATGRPAVERNEADGPVPTEVIVTVGSLAPNS